ncbi:MAG: cation diffusion facilitator family transporter [Planctomycetota bacterium]|jgi:cation diffusion facilitator family transporter
MVSDVVWRCAFLKVPTISASRNVSFCTPLVSFTVPARVNSLGYPVVGESNEQEGVSDMAGGGGNPAKAIMYAFGANLAIAILKMIAFFVTGSSSMLAEAIHSGADTGNQLLLLLGMKRAKKEPDREHPLGYGKASFFWAFIVAIMLFTFGGAFSIREGIHKLHNTGPVDHVWVALLVLGAGILLEGASLLGCVRVINHLRGDQGLWAWLKGSRNAELVVVFGEDLGALVGLILAMIFLSIAAITGDGVYDAYGSIAIGLCLLVISAFIAVRIHSLLIGSSAAPDVVEAIEAFIEEEETIDAVLNVITLQLGPQVLLAAKVRLRGDLSVNDACRAINGLERKVKARFPEIRWSFIEPDITDA